MLLRILLLRLLLLVIVRYFLTTAPNCPYHPTHRGPGGGTFAGITGDCPAHRSESSSAACTSEGVAP